MEKRVSLIILLFVIIFNFSQELRDLRVIDLNEEKEKEEEKKIIKPPGFSRISGFYPEDFKLKLISEDDTTIYYTDDTTDPRTSPTSKEFKNYILIYDRSSEPNVFAALNEDDDSPISVSRGHRFQGAPFNVDKAMVIRAAAKNSEGEFSEIITKTYFVTNKDLYKYQDFTVISLVTNPENLFDPEIGIYVTGNMYQNWKHSKLYDPTARAWDKNVMSNFLMRGSDWEREAFITIIDKGVIALQQNIGIRVKGWATRTHFSKSFNLYARKKYGKSTIETDLLKDNYDMNGNLITSYKSLSIRSVYSEERLRDKLGRDLYYMRKGFISQSMIPTILFLNGEYWGLYLLEEKIGNDFIESNYFVPSENIVMSKNNEIEDGPEEEFDKFQNFCMEYSEKDVRDPEIYEEIKNFIDIDSFVELYTTGLYIDNTDWPGKNDGGWKNLGEKIEGNEYSDGKWRFIIFDLDYSMRDFGGWGGGNRNWGGGNINWGGGNINWGGGNINWGGSSSFNHALSRIQRAPINYLFFALIRNNSDFQRKFVNVYCDLANDVYHPKRVNKILDKYREELTDSVADSLLRWTRSNSNLNSKKEAFSNYRTTYLRALDSISNFFEKRANITMSDMKKFLGLRGNLVDLNIEIIGKGKVQINTIIPEINNGKWTGKYFTRIPISIKAIPDVGYNFKKWNGFIQSTQKDEEIILFESQTIIVEFD